MSKKDEQEKEAREALRERREARLRARQAEKERQVRLVAFSIIGVIVAILLIGVIIEFVITPRQAVAEVNGENITLADWQSQVEYQRGQLIVGLNEQLDSFLDPDAEDPVAAEQQAIGFIQQFSGQQIGLLVQGHEQLGEFVLEDMIDSTLIRQEAEARGLTVTDAEVDAFLGEQFGYYPEGTPTPFPDGPDADATPTVTPVGFQPEEEEEEEGAEGEPVPTQEPLPTATLVTQDAFQEQLDDRLGRLQTIGADTRWYRHFAENALYREKLLEALYAAEGLPTVAEHASVRLLIANDGDDIAFLERAIEASDFLTVWNEVRSLPAEEQEVIAQATEILWQTEDGLLQQFVDDAVANAAFTLPVGGVSDVLATARPDGTPILVLVEVTGREERPLGEFALAQRQNELLESWLIEQRANVTRSETWRTRVPRTPALDPKFTQAVPSPFEQQQQVPPSLPVEPVEPVEPSVEE